MYSGKKLKNQFNTKTLLDGIEKTMKHVKENDGETDGI